MDKVHWLKEKELRKIAFNNVVWLHGPVTATINGKVVHSKIIRFNNWVDTIFQLRKMAIRSQLLVLAQRPKRKELKNYQPGIYLRYFNIGVDLETLDVPADIVRTIYPPYSTGG